MPSSVIGALRVSLGLDSAEFSAGAAQAERRARTMSDRVGAALRSSVSTTALLSGALGSVFAGATLASFAAATKRALDYTDAIQDLADRTGASTKSIQEFRYAAQLTGSSIEAADVALEKFARTQGLAQAGSDAQVKLFRELGVTSTDFDTALRQTIDGIAKLPTVQQRNAVAMQVFGKSAATLTGLLGQGTGAYDRYAAAAQRLGIVLDADVIANAGKVNDRLDDLKMVMDATFAGAIAKNADELAHLVQIAEKTFTTVVQYARDEAENIRTNFAALESVFEPFSAGAAAAFKDVRRDANYTRDTLASILGGIDEIRNIKISVENAQNKADSLLDPFSAAKPMIPQSNLRGIFLKRHAEVERQAKKDRLLQLGKSWNRGLYVQSKTKGGMIPTKGDGETAREARQASTVKSKMANDAERAAEKARDNEVRYQQELARAEQDRIGALLDLTVDVDERAALERVLNDEERKARLQAIAADKSIPDATKKEELSDLVEHTYGLKQNLIERRHDEALRREALELAQAQNDNDQDILRAQGDLARTSKERGRIELQLLDKQYDFLRRVQNDILASDASRSAKEAAQKTLATLDRTQGLARVKIMRENAGPLAAYLDSIPRSADEVNEAIEGIQAKGLADLIDGLSDVERGFEGLADTVESVANDIIRSLIRIGLQKAAAALFASLLGGQGGGGGITAASIGAGSLDVGTVTARGPTELKVAGFRAGGGSVVGGRNYVVGEMGPELFRAPGSGTIIAHDELGVGGRMHFEQHLHVTGNMDLATRTEVVRLAAATKDAAIAAIRDADRRR